MHKISAFLFTAILIFLPTLLMAQPDGPIEMADGLRSSGKIYVVVAVIVTLFAGLVLYIISLDRKISRLEKESNRSHG
jgi:integral membrane sensor domain MASE1